MLKKIGRWLAKRAKEKSSWAGIAVAAAALGLDKSGQVAQLAQVGSLIFAGGLIAHPTVRETE